MPADDVTDFMRQHAGDFRFVVGEQQESRIDVDEAAWQGEGIHLVRIVEDGDAVAQIRVVDAAGARSE